MIDHDAIKKECNATFPKMPCTWPKCFCITLPVKHIRADAEAQDKLREEIANSGDC